MCVCVCVCVCCVFLQVLKYGTCTCVFVCCVCLCVLCVCVCCVCALCVFASVEMWHVCVCVTMCVWGDRDNHREDHQAKTAVAGPCSTYVYQIMGCPRRSFLDGSFNLDQSVAQRRGGEMQSGMI